MKKLAVLAVLALCLDSRFPILDSSVWATPPKVAEPLPLVFNPPKGERSTLKNGMVVYLLEDHDLPLVHGSAIIKTGTFYDEAAKPGTAELVGDTMRSGGSRTYDADGMNETLEFLGASVETGMGDEAGSAGFTTLSKHVGTVLPIFADVLKNPAFRADKFTVEKEQMLDGIRRRNDDPRSIARRETRRILFGAAHPYGRRYEAAEVAAITTADLAAFHKKYFVPRAVVLAVSGDFQSKQMLAELEKVFGDWADTPQAALPAVPAAAADSRKVVLIAKDNITQTAFRVAQSALKRHDPGHFDFEVMNDILGGNSFISRLFTDVRSRQGLAYGVGSLFAEWGEAGYFTAACGTRNENAIKALKAVMAHIELIRKEPVKDAELETAKSSLINSFIFHYQTSAQIIGQRASLEYYGYPADYLDTYLDHVRKVGKEQVLKAAAERLKPADSLILVVGPSSLQKDLEQYGKVEVRKPD